MVTPLENLLGLVTAPETLPAMVSTLLNLLTMVKAFVTLPAMVSCHSANYGNPASSG